MERTANEAKVFVENVNIKEIAKEILGTNYNFIYRFCYNFIFNPDYDYKFTKTRRSYVLVQIFKDIIESEDKEGKTQLNEKISNIFTDVYAENVKSTITNQTKILVVDDILIYGRAITIFLLDMMRECNCIDKGTTQIEVDVIAKCHEDERYKKVLLDCMKGNLQPSETNHEVIQVSEGLWKDLSNQIVKLILTLGYDYTAFSDSLVVHENPSEKFKDAMRIPQLAIQESADSELSVLIPNVDSDKNSIEKYSKIFRRLYSNPRGKNRYRILDFCILPMFEIKAWSSFVYNIFDVNITPSDHATEIITMDDGSEYTLYTKESNKLIYYYKCFAYIIGIDSLNNIKEDQDVLLNLCGRYSFGYTNLEEMNIVHVSDCYKKNYNEEIKILDQSKGCVLNDAAKIWEKIVSKHTDFSYFGLSEAFESFIKSLHEKNENNAEKNQEKLQGAFLLDLVWILEREYNKKGMSFDEKQLALFLGVVYNFCDNGLVTCNVEIFESEQDQYIGYCITDGEQACRAGSDNGCLLELKSLNYIKQYTKTKGDFVKEVNNFISRIEEMNVPNISLSKIDKIKDYFENNQVVEGAISAYRRQPLPYEIARVLSSMFK